MMPKMMSRLGLLEDKLVETTAQKIQGEYVGQSEKKAAEMMEAASGGVLFVDEAHNLGNSHFSKQAAQVLMTATLEEQHKGNTMLILAGYPDQMHSMMQNLDPGFQRRFTQTLEFEDWSAEDCVDYLKQLCIKEEIGIDTDAAQHVVEVLGVIKCRPGWGNASDSKYVFESLKKSMAVRAMQGALQDVSKIRIQMEDAIIAMKAFLSLRPEKKIEHFGSTHFSLASDFVPQNVCMDQTSNPARSPRKARISVVEDEMQEEINDDGEDQVFSALQLACVELGYDKDQESRTRLIGVLQTVISGESFTDDILEHVKSKTGLKETKINAVLRPQVHSLLQSMKDAVAAEETRLEEIRRLEEQNSLEQIRQIAEKRQRIQKKLRTMGCCPAGFGWYKIDGGWRCHGGSHCVSDVQLE